MEHRTFFKKVKNYYATNKCVILCLAATIGILVFIYSWYLFCVSFIVKPLSESQFQYYEQIARDVYNQKDQTLIEIPDGVLLEKTPTEIIVKSQERYFGKVVANLKNGELVITRDFERNRATSTIVLATIIYVLIICDIILLGYKIYTKVKKSR